MMRLASRSRVAKRTGAARVRHSTRRDANRRRGAAAVEFAIVANVLFLFVLVCIDFARMNMVRNLAQDAAYFAARHTMVPGATREEAVAVAEDIMGSMLTTGVTINVPTIDQNSSEIVVTVDVDLNAVALVSSSFFPDPILRTRASLGTERYTGFFRQ